MLKAVLTLLIVLISVYWIGEKMRKNPKIDAFLSKTEGRYSKLNELLADTSVTEGLRFLQKVYGWLSVILGIVFLVCQRFSSPTQSLPIVIGFCVTFMGWFSIKWVREHKRTIADFARKNAIFVFGPLIMGLFDTILGTPFIQTLMEPARDSAAKIGYNFPQFSGPLAAGAATSLVILSMFAIYYLLTWCMAGPIFLASVSIVLLPTRLAKAFAAIDRDNTFFWLTVFLMAAISLWLTRL